MLNVGRMRLSIPLLTLATLCNLSLSVSASPPARADERTHRSWTWRGFEVIGNRQTSKKDILALIPIHEGETYQEAPEKWKQWCANIKSNFDLVATECSSVRYANFDAYFVVEIVEPGFEYRNQFRTIPPKNIPLANQEILSTYEKLYQRLWDLFNAGTPPEEHASQGYLDYSDTQMQGYVQRLIQLVPAYRANLLEVLANDQDINKREKAANLLNWSVENLTDSILRSNQLLDDPSSLVRNNISRFTLHFVDKLQKQTERREVINNLLAQLDRPSFADRNKSIYNLLLIARKFASDRLYIRARGISLIRYISEASILSNVRDPALQLIELIESERS